MLPYLGKDVEKLDHSHTAEGDMSGIATLKSTLAVSKKLQVSNSYIT